MPPRYDLEIKARLLLGLALLGLLVVLLLRLLLPVLLVAVPTAGGYWLWRQWQRQQRQRQRHQAQLNAKFYQLLQQQRGRISVLDFAMYAKLEGAAAQSYLNDQAQTFSAYFDTTAQGDIIYVFNVAAVRGGGDSPAQSPPEATWAYADQVRTERARAAKAQTAWANAKQIRALRQLSRCDLKHNSAERSGQESLSDQSSQSDEIVTIDVPAVRG